MRPRQDDTIAALATPPGAGALAVVRLSGPAAVAIAGAAFRGSSPLSAAPGHTVHVGRFLGAGGALLDDVVLTLFRSPRSYTGEDLVEITCHGGPLPAAGILRALVAGGARQADPGEFTRRAFLNGRMDLAQAEAVAGLIAAGSERARRSALDQLHGALSRRIAAARDALLTLCGRLELNLDFVEDDIDIATNSYIEGEISNSITDLSALLQGYAAGRLLREGFRVAIVGPPNAGKSSIFNRLLESDRAIVTPHAGTTRDMLEENVGIGGYLFRLRDTAGLRRTEDPVELEGIRRAEEAAGNADVLLVVRDASVEVRGKAGSAGTARGGEVIRVLNKADLLPSPPPGPVSSNGELVVSAKTGLGVEALREALVKAAGSLTAGGAESELAINERHRGALERTIESLRLAAESAGENRPQEFVAVDLRAALNHLAEITGEVTTDQILDGIFSRFCIGK
jgi:tRNA modification GTPase